MALTPEQQERVIGLLMEQPHRRDEILAEAGKISRENEGTLERSLNLAGSAFLRELPLGYGEELGLTGPSPGARNIVEQGAEIIGGVAGAVPSFFATGGAGAAAIRAIPRAAKAVQAMSPAARLIGRDVGVSGATEFIRKPEEDRSRWEMAAKGALAGAGASAGFAAMSPALTKMGAQAASRYGDRALGRAIRPASASLGGTSGAAVASAAIDDEFRLDEVLMEGIGAGVFSAIDMGALDTAFMDKTVSQKFFEIQQEGRKKGNYAESLVKILDLAEQNPGAKKLVGDQVFQSVLESMRPHMVKKMVDNTNNPIEVRRETDDVRALVHVKREEGWEGSPMSEWIWRQVPMPKPLHSNYVLDKEGDPHLLDLPLQIPQRVTPDQPLEGVLPLEEQYPIHTVSRGGTGDIASQGLPGEGRSFSPDPADRPEYTDSVEESRALVQKANTMMRGILKEHAKGEEYADWLHLIAEEAAPLLGRPVDWHESMTVTQLDALLGENVLTDLQNPRWDFVYEQALSDVDEGPLDLGGTGATKEKTLGEIVAEEGGIRAEGGEWDQLKDEVKKKRYNWARGGIGKIVYLDGKSGRPLDDIAASIQDSHPGRIKDAEDLRQKLLHTDVLTPVEIAEDNYFSQMEESRRQLAEDYREDPKIDPDDQEYERLIESSEQLRKSSEQLRKSSDQLIESARKQLAEDYREDGKALEEGATDFNFAMKAGTENTRSFEGATATEATEKARVAGWEKARVVSQESTESGTRITLERTPPGAAAGTELGYISDDQLKNLRDVAREAEDKMLQHKSGYGNKELDNMIMERYNQLARTSDAKKRVSELSPQDYTTLLNDFVGKNVNVIREKNVTHYFNQLGDLIKGWVLPIKSYMDREGTLLLRSNRILSMEENQAMMDVVLGEFSPDSPMHQRLVDEGLVDGQTGKLTPEGQQARYMQRDFTEQMEIREGDVVRINGAVEAGIDRIGGEINYHPELFYVVDQNKNVVFDADPEVAVFEFDGSRRFETEMDGRGKGYQMRPGDRLVTKTNPHILAFRTSLMQQADRVVNEMNLRYVDWYNGFIDDAKARGMSEGEAWAMVSDEKINDIHDPMLNERSERLDSEEAPRLSMMDVLLHRDGVDTWEDVDTAVADGRVPDWYVPHMRTLAEINNEFAGQAQAVGLKIRDSDGNKTNFMPQEFYVPMYYDQSKLDSEDWRSKQVKAMAKKLLAVAKRKDPNTTYTQTQAEADAFNRVSATRFHHDRRVNRSGNLERAREMDPEDGYLINPKLIWGQYAHRSVNRIMRAHLFGAEDEVAKHLLLESKMQGASDLLEQNYMRFAGQIEDSPITADVVSGLNQFTALTRMTWSFLPQMLQINNTAAVAGYKNTLRGMVNALRAASKEDRDAVGASFSEWLNGLAVAGLDTRPNAKLMKWAPNLRAFAWTDRFARDVSGLTAVPYMESIGKKLVANPRSGREIAKARELGIDPGELYRSYRDRGSNQAAWDKVVNRAGMQLSNKTQFLSRSENLPLFWQSPIGRAATMFKGFLLQQTRMMRDLFMPEWSSLPKSLRGKNKRGVSADLMRLMMFSGAGLAGGEIVNDIKALMAARRRPDEMTERIMQNVMTAGSAGLALEIMRSISEGRTQAYEAVMGPSISNVLRLASDGGSMFWKMGQEAMSDEPMDWNRILGPTVRNVTGQSAGPAAMLAAHMGFSGKALQAALMAGALGQQTAGRILAPPQQKKYQAVPLDDNYAETVLTGKSDQERMEELIKQIRRLNGNADQMAKYGF